MSHRFLPRPPNWISLKNAKFKFILAPRQWQVFTNFYATILVHVLTLYSKKYFLIFLPVFHLLFLTTLFMKFLIADQVFQSTLHFQFSIQTIQLFFPKLFSIIFLLIRKFLPQVQAQHDMKKHRPRTTDRHSAPAPGRLLDLSKTPGLS